MECHLRPRAPQICLPEIWRFTFPRQPSPAPTPQPQHSTRASALPPSLPRWSYNRRRQRPRWPRPHPAAPRAEAQGAPLLVRAARGEAVERPPAWMMRQAGRYQKAYRDLAEKHPSFRDRSEKTDLIVEISLQPWESFKPDGVILFSDILTPLNACGVPFEIDDNKGPLVEAPIVDEVGLAGLHAIELEKLDFVGESLGLIRKEVGPAGAAVLGFVGSPWTLATYVVEGKSTSIYKVIKTLMFQNPKVLDGILSHLADQIATYACYQIESGAHYLQARPPCRCLVATVHGG